MTKKMPKKLLAAVLGMCMAPALRGQTSSPSSDFSAEIVETIQGDARPRITKVYVHGTRLRMIDATPEQKNDGSYMLIDHAKRTVYAVMPAQKMYIDMSETTSQAGELFARFFHVPNPEDACPGWQQILQSQHKTST